MSGSSGKKGAGAWTEAEKISLLVQIVQQIGADKPAIKFDQIHLLGRTPRAMRDVFAKIKAEASVLSTGGAPSSSKPGTTLKNKAISKADGESPAKKKKTTPKKKKVESYDDEDESESMPELRDSSDDAESDVQNDEDYFTDEGELDNYEI